MRPELQRRFDAIEGQRAVCQSTVRQLIDAQLDWTPANGVWSVRQTVEHLVLSDEQLGRARDAQAVENEALMFRLLPRALRRALILRAFRRDIVLPLPSPALEPRGDVPLSGLLERWDGARRGMRDGLASLQGDERRYAHPVLGPLSAAQMLELEQAHTAYHTRQMQALQRAASFPSG